MLLAFTFFMGLMLSRMISMVLGFKNGPELIMTAFGGTAGVFFVMASLATVIKRDLSGLGKWLFVGLLVLLVGSLVNLFVGSSAGMLALSVAAIGIFSFYMLYDLKQIIDGGETNYISATLSLYVSIYNIFVSLLQILMAFSGNDRDCAAPRRHLPLHAKARLLRAFVFWCAASCGVRIRGLMLCCTPPPASRAGQCSHTRRPSMSDLYGPQHQALQDRFDSRRMAERVREIIVTPEIGEQHQGFIESRDFFFLTTIDHRGFPTVSHKGGHPGFVRVADPATLVFPSYDGNGMFLSMGHRVEFQPRHAFDQPRGQLGV